MMKTILITILLCVACFFSKAQVSFVAIGGNAGNGNAAVTTATVTTTATLIVVDVSFYDGGTGNTLADSKGNTWILGQSNNSSPTVGITHNMYYCLNPTVGAAHTFTFTSTGGFPSINYCAVTNVLALDKNGGTNGGSSGVSSIQPGSLTPTQSGELIFCGMGSSNTGSTPTINSGFTIAHGNNFVGGTSEVSSLAYLIQGSAAAVNPTWSWTTPALASCGMLTFTVSNSGNFFILLR